MELLYIGWRSYYQKQQNQGTYMIFYKMKQQLWCCSDEIIKISLGSFGMKLKLSEPKRGALSSPPLPPSPHPDPNYFTLILGIWLENKGVKGLHPLSSETMGI